MRIIEYKKENIPEIERLVDHGHTANIYLTKDHHIFKLYNFDNETCLDYYQELVSYHNQEFLEYLIGLSQLDIPNLVTPDDIYVNGDVVRGYSYPYQIGNRIDELYPKTSLNRLLAAIDRLFDTIERVDNIKIFDMHQRNIIYTGEIQLIDLDFCELSATDYKSNIANINHGLINGILKVYYNHRIVDVDERISDIYKQTLIGEVRASDFLREYINVLDNDAKYIKHLSKRLIKESKNE